MTEWNAFEHAEQQPKQKGWRRYDDLLTVASHLIPIDDERYHSLSADCWCLPLAKPDVIGLLYFHSAIDGRPNPDA